jgi:hypothetical protein
MGSPKYLHHTRGKNLGDQEPNHKKAYSKLVILLILAETEFGAHCCFVLEGNAFGWNFCILRPISYRLCGLLRNCRVMKGSLL